MAIKRGRKTSKARNLRNKRNQRVNMRKMKNLVTAQRNLRMKMTNIALRKIIRPRKLPKRGRNSPPKRRNSPLINMRPSKCLKR